MNLQKKGKAVKNLILYKSLITIYLTFGEKCNSPIYFFFLKKRVTFGCPSFGTVDIALTVYEAVIKHNGGQHWIHNTSLL